MKEKYVSRFKLFFMLLPVLAVAFYVLSSITGGGASSVFTPAEIVNSICEMEQPPESGTPLDYSPMENFRFANFVIFNSSYFQADSVGTCKADLGFTKYTQNVRNSRKVKQGTVFAETVSTSSLVSVAEQKYITPNDTVLFRPSEKVRGENVTWSSSIYPMSTDTFFSKYGAVPREITKYSVTEESVSSAKLISFGNDEYVYEFELIPEIGGKYFKNEIRTLASAAQDPVIHSMTLTMTIDSNWYAKTVLCVDTYDIAIPVLGSMSCVSTMLDTFSYINEDMPLPESEIFEPFLPEDGDNTDIPDIPAEKNASTYLAEAFAPYLNGEKLTIEADALVFGSRRNIKASVDISSMNISALVDDALFFGYDGERAYVGAGIVKGYLPISALSRLLELDFGFDFDKINIGGIDLSALLNADFEAMLTDDIIGSLFADSDLVKENGLVTITLKFKLSDLLKSDCELVELASKIELDVDLVINDGENVSLNSINATVKINGIPVIIDITPRDGFDFPDTSEFVSLEPVLDFVEPALNTANAKSFDIALTANVESANFTDKITANILLNRDLTLCGKISLEKLGIAFDVCFDGETVYLKCGNVGIKADVADFDDLKSEIAELLSSAGIVLPDVGLNQNIEIPNIAHVLANLDLKALFAHITEFQAVEGNLRAAVEIDGKNYGITLCHDGKYLSSLNIDEIEANGAKIKLDAVLSASETEKNIAAADIEYIDANDLLRFVEPIKELVNKRGVVADFNAVIALDGESIAVTGQIAVVLKQSGADFQINLSLPQVGGENLPVVFSRSGKDYRFVYDELRVCGNKDDFDAFMQSVQPMLPKFLPRLIADLQNKIDEATPDLNANSVLDMIDFVKITNSESLEIGLKFGDVALDLCVNLKNGTLGGITLHTELYDETIGTVAINASLDLSRVFDQTEAEEYVLSSLNLDYTPASELISYFDALLGTFKQQAYRVTFHDIRVWYKDKTHKVDGYAEIIPKSGIPNLRLGFNVYETAATGVDANFDSVAPRHTFEIMITDGDPLQEIYLTYNGVKFKLTVAEVLNLLGNVKDALGIKDGTILDYVIPKDREIVSGEFLKDFDIEGFAEMSELINGLLDIATQVCHEAQEFMYDYDYDYTEFVNTASDVIGRISKLFGTGDISSPGVGQIVNLIRNLPRVSLKSVTAENGETSTLTVRVGETDFTLTRTNDGNPVLTDWSMSNLHTSNSVTSFRLSLDCPDANEIKIERPVYHDYNYATSAGGTYKRQELIDNILAGKLNGVSLPNYKEEYVRHDVSFGESDIIKSQRFKRSWDFWGARYKYTQSNDGEYVRMRTDEYLKISDGFVDKIKDLTYVEYNGEYWTYADFHAMKNTVSDNGQTTSLDDYFSAWFESTYGMKYETYYKQYLEGNCLNDLSNVSNLTTALLNTANLSDFHISGNLNVHIGIVNIDINVPIDARVKLIPTPQPDGSIVNKPLVIVSLSTPKKSIIVEVLEKSASQIYYLDGYMYFNKLDKNGKYNFVKVAVGDLMNEMSGTDGINNIMEYVFYVAPMSGILKSTITDQISKGGNTTPGEFKDFYKHYYFKDNRHYAKIDLGSLAGNTSLSEAELFIGTRKTNIGTGEKTFINELGFSTSMASVVSMKFEAVLADIGEEIETFRVATGFNGDTPIYDERPIETLREYLDSHSYGTIKSPVQE